MKPSILCFLLASLMTASGTQRESFDTAWKFARYGNMPDGGKLAEPAGEASPAAAYRRFPCGTR